MTLLRSFALLVVLLVSPVVQGFYLPGVAPRAYQKDEVIPLLVNRLDSAESILPYDYYRFDFCEPGEELSNSNMAVHKPREGAKVSENLGQIVLGERIRHSPYHFRMLEPLECVPLCTPKVYKDEKDPKYARLLHIIKKDYMHHWIMDNLPAVECIAKCRGGPNPEDQPYYRMGFPVGCAIGKSSRTTTTCSISNVQSMYSDEIFLNNHIDFTISYHESDSFVGARIVGVEVRPRSIQHTSVDDMQCDGSAPPQVFTFKKDSDKAEPLTIIYSYSVVWKPSDIKWASRWDSYLRSGESASIHWFSIVNSLVIVVFLSGMVAVIIVRTLHRDISRYNQNENLEEAQEEFGWKLVHGDVFRPPSHPMMLAVCVGTGLQIGAMCVVTLLFACLGFLSPATRGGLMTVMLVLYVGLGVLTGYVSARCYKMLGGEQWKTNVLFTSFFFPGIVFFIFFVLNLVLWHNESSAAVPFGTLVALVLLWFCVSVPLTFLGAYMGFKKPVIDQPVRTNQIPRQIPPQPAYAKPLAGILMGGILPFGCIFIQLFFILSSIWTHKLYYVFGFLFLVFIILVVTTTQSSILLCYFHLCTEDYHWWWRSFLTGGSAAIYLFFYAFVFYFKRMHVEGFANFVLYAGYTLIISILFWAMTGAVGFSGCFLFIRQIYSVIKVD